MEEKDIYKNNSYRYTENNETNSEKRVQKVTTGTAKKKTFWQKLKASFIAEEADSVGDYITNDILIPAIKKTISDIVKNGVDISLGTQSIQKTTADPYAQNYRPHYAGYYDSKRTQYQPTKSYSYDDIVLSSRGEAEAVLIELKEAIRNYQFARVADLYDCTSLPVKYTDNNYGWDDLSRAEIVRLNDGRYWLKLPRPIPID